MSMIATAIGVGVGGIGAGYLGSKWGGSGHKGLGKDENLELLGHQVERARAGTTAMKDLQNYYQTGNFKNLFTTGQAYRQPLGSYGPTSQEGQGLGVLSGMITGQAPELFRVGSNEIRELVEGDKYDPLKNRGTYFEPYKKAIMDEYGEMSNLLDANLGAQGGFYSSERSNQQRKLGETTQNQLAQLLGGLYQNYQGQKLVGAGTLADMGVAEQNLKMQQVQASQQYGQLERLLEDQKLKEQYNEWLRQRSEYADLINTAKSLYSGGAMPSSFGTAGAGGAYASPKTTAFRNTMSTASNIMTKLAFGV